MTAQEDTYDDGLVRLDRRALTLRRYHFPDGTSKVVPLQGLRGYRAMPMSLLDRTRMWGTTDLRRWWPLDVGRPLRSTVVTLDIPGARLVPAFTPADPGRFTAVLDALLAARE